MASYRNRTFAGLYLCVLFLAAGCSESSKSPDPLSCVDPQIGGVGLLLQPTRPTVQLPNRMIRVYPVRNDYLDDRISFFLLSIISHRNGELFGIMPFTGRISSHPVSSWDNQLEVSTPYYLSTWLVDYDITVEFTPSEKSGFFRVTYPGSQEKGLFLFSTDDIKWERTGSRSLTGEQEFSGMKAYAYLESDRDIETDDKIVESSGSRISYISFTGDDKNIVMLRYGISFTSPEQAKKNLEKDIPGWDFDEIKANAKTEWEKVLGKIRVEGGTEAQRRVFYTALYRCHERMIDINEGGIYYSNYDSSIHHSDRRFYVDDWIWDTYLALHPLRTILDPETEADMIQSYADMYTQSGWLPTFPVLYGDTPCMNGFHSAIMVLDAYRKGLRNFDIAKCYEGMRKNAMEATMLPWRNGPACSLDTFYYENGFFPALRPGEKENIEAVHPWEKRQSVALTLGHSYDDWAVAQMAKELGKDDDYGYFMKRSQNYLNLWWPEKGFFMPKDLHGNWIEIDPSWDGGMGGRDYYDENNGWTYLWQVQHDLPGLMRLMGGKSGFEEKLDRLFTEDIGRSKYELWAKFPDFSGIVGQFSMGNEPSFHIPYLYNLTGSPWKTQKKIRMLLDAWFHDNIFGIPGDEDGGGMSAFVVFSCMGFYPLTPGIPEYTIGSPVFTKVTIGLPGGKKFIIEAEGAGETNKYIQNAWLNGKPLDTPWFSHKDLIKGGVLKFEMGPYPNRTWGTGAR